ncbi:hypothetical protein GJU40_12145 [Bacillus lacus]|uniref:Uncharacterized protein n=1 Tax=Metabacillus lacus TaxID=1983721 RepID=A0A7X2LYZ4_9BACI|nr:hypothetical protein [Metabacillus lacus]MRX72891.1 hypothetical protein [Metabacillus lacus]
MKQFIEFIDGDGYDRGMDMLLKGLYTAIVFFCLPYLLAVVTSLFI